MKAIFAIENAVSCVSLRKSANRFCFHGTATGWLRVVHGLLGAMVLSFAASGAAQAQVTLTVSDVGTATAKFTVTGSSSWYYKEQATSGNCDGPVTVSSKDLSGLTPNTKYEDVKVYSEVTCVNVLSDSPHPDFVTVPGKPEKPTVSVGVGSGKLRLQASLDSTTNGTETLEQWQYRWKKETDSDWVGTWNVLDQTTNTLDHTTSNLSLTDGNSYVFEVRAVNADGLASVWSDTSDAATPADVTLTAALDNDVTKATLTISNSSEDWYYKRTVPSGGACSPTAVSSGTETASLTGLAGNTNYTYSAYSDSGCTMELASVAFLNKPDKPTGLTVSQGNVSGELILSGAEVTGDGAITGWQYAHNPSSLGPDSFGDWKDISNSSLLTKLSSLPVSDFDQLTAPS